MLLMVRRLSGRFGFGWPLLLSVGLLSAEYGVYALGHSAAVLFAAQLLRGFSYALYVAGRYQYVSRLAQEGMEGSTQALVNTVSAVASLASAAAGGFLLEALGTRPFFAVLCGIQLISGLFFIGLHVFGVRVLHTVPKDRQCRLFGWARIE